MPTWEQLQEPRPAHDLWYPDTEPSSADEEQIEYEVFTADDDVEYVEVLTTANTVVACPIAAPPSFRMSSTGAHINHLDFRVCVYTYAAHCALRHRHCGP